MKYQLTAQVQRVLKEGRSEGWWYCTIRDRRSARRSIVWGLAASETTGLRQVVRARFRATPLGVGPIGLYS